MKWVDLLMILMILMILINLGPLGLYEDIDNTRPRARDLCTSYATENTDYLTHPLSFDLVEDEASHLLVSVNASNEP
jgi:hypothetical protein